MVNTREGFRSNRENVYPDATISNEQGRLASVKSIAQFPFRLALHRLGLSKVERVCYLVPRAGWSTDWDGYYITSNIAQQFGIKAGVTSKSRWMVGQIFHHSSLWSFLGLMGGSRHKRNNVVVTVFHGDRSEQFPELKQGIESFLSALSEVDTLVTSCSLMEKRFIEWGVPSSKVRCIPLGVDLTRFLPLTSEGKRRLRKKIGIPDDSFCIGSFHKDGNGWDDGVTPKMIKGPDIFLEVIDKLRRRFKVFVCLSGPARGYVKRGLEKLGVDYYHRHFTKYHEVAALYHCLDAYLVTSREEGGPKGVLESMASGVPLVSTRVGLAPDVVEQGKNGFLTAIEDVESLVEYLAFLQGDPSKGRELADNGLDTIQAYDWPLIAARYYQEVYRPLLDEAGR